MCFVVTPVLFIMMKRIIIIDGGPRKAMNTAAMLSSIAQGVKSVSDQIEVKTVRLYELNYKGCMSCLLCKLKGRVSNVCKFKDALTPVLQEIAEADGLVMGSPIYFSEVTAQLRAFLARLVFPRLSYNDYSLTAPKRIPVILSYTMNANGEQAMMGSYEAFFPVITAQLLQQIKFFLFRFRIFFCGDLQPAVLRILLHGNICFIGAAQQSFRKDLFRRFVRKQFSFP